MLQINLVSDDHRAPITFNIRSISGLAVDKKNIRLRLSYMVQKLQSETGDDGNTTYIWNGVTQEDEIATYNNFAFALFEVSCVLLSQFTF